MFSSAGTGRVMSHTFCGVDHLSHSETAVIFPDCETSNLKGLMMARHHNNFQHLFDSGFLDDFLAQFTGGSAQHDHLNGTESGNVLFSGRSDDSVAGMAGNDTLNGGSGNDKIWGGSGNDQL